MSGDVTYQIGGHFTSPQGSYDYWFPLSELKWPLNVTVGMVGGSVPLSSDWEASAELSKSLQTAAGKMQDSDWTDGNNPQLKTIYSESSAVLQSFTGDADLRYWASQQTYDDLTLGFALGGGWLYEHFSWDARDLDQWYPQNPEQGHDLVAGLIGTYATTVNMPYFEAAAKFEARDVLSLLLRFCYSPVAAVDDKDDHILRQIAATANLQGNAYKLSLEGRYAFSPRYFLAVRGDMLSFDLKGVESNVVYGGADQGDTWSIEHRIISIQYLLSLTAGVRF
jgi:outer membrane protease